MARPRGVRRIQPIVGAILRGDEVIVPHGRDRIQGDDTLLVFTTAASAPQVRDFFLPRG